jgi:hypothetical protein
MPKICSSRPLLVVALVLVASTAFAQSVEKSKPSASITGKATASKVAQSKAAPERKRYEFTGAAAVGSTQATGSSANQVSPVAEKEKSNCHSKASDA